jgi:hypothetical protein
VLRVALVVAEIAPGTVIWSATETPVLKWRAAKAARLSPARPGWTDVAASRKASIVKDLCVVMGLFPLIWRHERRRIGNSTGRFPEDSPEFAGIRPDSG